MDTQVPGDERAKSSAANPTPVSYSAFISYASDNIERAEAICASLEAKGFRCWMAPRDIRAGFEYADEIVRGIEQSRCMVVVISEAANASPFVRREVERAVSKRKPIFPVRIEEVLPSPGLELFISATHWIDAWGSRFTEQVDRLARDLSGVSPAGRPSWRARIRHLRRRAKRWATTAALAIAGLAIVVYAGISLVREIPEGLFTGSNQAGAGGSGPGTGAARGNSARDKSGVSIGGGSAATGVGDAGKSNVAPEGGAVIDALREPYKQRAAATPNWLQCSEWFCTVARLNTWYAGVNRISFGENRDQLERTIDIVLPAGATRAEDLRASAEQYVMTHIPIRPGVDSIFVRLDFYDGTRSDIRPARIDPADRTTLGVSLPGIDGPANVTVPLLYAGYTLGQPRIHFTPDATGAEAVMYSLDEGGFSPSAVVATARTAKTPRGFRFEGRPAGRSLRMEIRGKGGEPIGPFRYDAAPAASLILATMKASLLGDLYSLVKCTRIGQEFSERSLASARTSQDAALRREGSRLTSALESEGLSFVTRGPAIACRADWEAHGRRTRNYLGDWAAVKELHIGTRTGRLGMTVSNTLEMTTALEDRAPRGREFSKIWNAILPADAQGVYVQLEFRDGSTSPEFRVPIVELR